MENTFWNITHQERALSSAELIPVIILGVEALLGIACNLTAAWIYWQQKRGLFQNPGNAFTVSLIVDDLILSGVAIPLVIAVVTTDKSESPIASGYLCLGARCALLFITVSSATGSALLALDRVDITLRPSKRFFRQKRAEISLAVVWIFSISSLLVPVWTTLSLEHGRTQHRNRTMFVSKHLISTEQFPNTSSSEFTRCNATCYSNYCAVTEFEFIVRTAIQTCVFVCAATVIVITYSKILRSVKKRDVKRGKNIHMNKCSHTNNKRKCILGRFKCHHKEKEESAPLKQGTTISKLQTKQNSKNHCRVKLNNKKEEPVSKASGLTKSSNNGVNKEFKIESNSQDGNLNSNIVSAEKQPDLHPGRANFASVALSVQAFIALKRIVKERAEIKRKKHRHLRRMTVAITLIFLACWIPFHILPLVRISLGEIPDKTSTCKLTECLHGEDTDSKAIHISQPYQALNVAFLWVFTLASLSSIANPYLYSFSREKIRQEVCRTFCKSKNGFICKHSKDEKFCKATFDQNNKNGTGLARSKNACCEAV